MGDGQVKVKLGDSEYVVVPQRIGRLEHQLQGLLGDLASASDSDNTGDFLQKLGTRGYEVLHVFIPDIMPEHRFRGYASAAALEKGEYSDEDDQSPSFDQIVDAFNAVMRVNRVDVFGGLKNVLGPDFLRALIRSRLAEMETRRMSGTSTS